MDMPEFERVEDEEEDYNLEDFFLNPILYPHRGAKLFPNLIYLTENVDKYLHIKSYIFSFKGWKDW